MTGKELIPHLFRSEYRKMVSVLCRRFGIEHIGAAEDIVSDTFLAASEVWGLKGVPEHPIPWLYTVAGNKAKDFLKRHNLFTNVVSGQIRIQNDAVAPPDIDLSVKNINDSQLAMMFVVCHPCNPPEAQVGLALSLLCGFGVDEIAQAFLTNSKNIYKRLQRAKQRLKNEGIAIEQPSPAQIKDRLPNVAMTLYLLFNEGYYSAGSNIALRLDLCAEAMRLVHMLIEKELTDKPFVNALFALMCFQASRFDARTNGLGQTILYQEQDKTLWNKELITNGEFFLNKASSGEAISKFHLEAGIAYWHTRSGELPDKWKNILQLYNYLLVLEYSPVAALNRTYAFAMVHGNEKAIEEAEKINLEGNYLYHSLLGELYMTIDKGKAITHFENARNLIASDSEKAVITRKILRCADL